MIIKTLSMNNFGVFCGEHVIALTPRETDGQPHPIVLFGGLNGSGKTTILTAIKLALFGPRCLGKNVSKRAYQEFLEEYVHTPPGLAEPPNKCHVSLTFEHGENGIISTYVAERQWSLSGQEIKEKLSLSRDGEILDELSHEHCQATLNDLVPFGVADLFFFDGEKIKELAEEEGSAALRETVYRLMGIDTIHRLRKDLVSYVTSRSSARLSSDNKKELKRLEDEYVAKKHAYENLKSKHDTLVDQLKQVEAEINETNRILNERGGAWASSRKSDQEKVEELTGQQSALNERVREVINGLAPLILAETSLKKLIKKLQAEQDAKRQAILTDALRLRLGMLKKELVRTIPKASKDDLQRTLDRSFHDLLQEPSTEILHDVSDSQFADIRHVVQSVLPTLKKKLRADLSELKKIDRKLVLHEKNADRVPDEEALREELSRLHEQTKQKAGLGHSIEISTEEMRRMLREMIDLTRKQRRLSEDLNKVDASNSSEVLANRTIPMLMDFAERATVEKVRNLEFEFSRAFQKLARKEDVHLYTSIDPKSFSVALHDEHGNSVNKQQLSAGEKQIYAIAMLEALGRTTGRQLPVIIDTPLGRLDSKHRNNLVQNYFPNASHQVIILSTDTEVDEEFFNQLQDDISHGYEIIFDTKSRSSSLKEGYFWNPTLQEAM